MGVLIVCPQHRSGPVHYLITGAVFFYLEQSFDYHLAGSILNEIPVAHDAKMVSGL